MVKSGDDTEHARRDFYRDPQLKPEDDIEGSSWGMTQSLGILNFSGVLGVPKGLERSPYKICELDLSSLKVSKNLKFLK